MQSAIRYAECVIYVLHSAPQCPPPTHTHTVSQLHYQPITVKQAISTTTVTHSP